MARFGQSFIQSLTKPSYQQGLFNLGEAIGSAPARQRQMEEEKSFQKNLFDLQQQGIAATQKGVADPRALQNRINQLTELASTTRNPAQAEAARKSALALQSQMGQVSEMAVNRGARNAVELAKAIDAGQFDSNPQAKTQLQQRLQTLRQDPLANAALQTYDQGKAKMGIDQLDAQMKALSSSFFANGVRPLTQEEAKAMLTLEQQKIQLAQSAGLKVSDYVGQAKDLVNKSRDAAWSEYTVSNERNEQIQDNLVTKMIDSAITKDDPYAFIDASLPQEYAYLKDRVVKGIQDREESLNAAEEVRQNSQLTPQRIEWLKRNENIFDENAELLEQFNIYKNKNTSPRQKRLAAKNLNAAIDIEQGRQRKLETTDSFAKEKAVNALNFILGNSDLTYMSVTNQGIKQETIPAGTGMFEDPDVLDAAEEINESDRRDDFLNRLTNVYKLNPRSNPRDAVVKVLNDMDVDISGERLTERRRQEAIKENQMVQTAIDAAYEEAGIDPETATGLERDKILRKVGADLFAKESRMNEERMQRVQDVRSQTRTARYGENPFR